MERQKMNTPVIKIIIILGLMFGSRVFSDSYPDIYHELYLDLETLERISYDTNRAGMIKASGNVYYKKGHVYSETIHDRKGNLIHSRKQLFINGLLVQITNDSVVRNVIPGITRCDLIIIEPSGESVFIKLDPYKEPKNPYGKEEHAFLNSKLPPKDKKHIYDMIIFNKWNSDCQFSVGFW
ncbi:MAG: hypothetical protein LBQ87_07060 [Candidatus Fibromonas sp.]|nr:hypothetical protein [Candidatus Fibromonas sp.]